MNRLYVSLCMVLLSLSLWAQKSVETVKQKLVEHGFESVACFEKGDAVYVSYESNLYVWNVRELNALLEIIAAELPDSKVKVLTKREGRAVLATEYDTKEWKEFRAGKRAGKEMAFAVTSNTDDLRSMFKGEEVANSNIGKVDIVAIPEISVQNRRLDRAYEVLINISPAVELSLWKGSKITAQVLFPVLDHYYSKTYGFWYNSVRPGYLTLSQEFTLPQQWYVRLAGGNFNSNRMGFDATVEKVFFKDLVKAGVNIGLTGDSYFDGFKKWYYSTPKDVSAIASVSCYIPYFDAEVGVSGGRYHNGTKAVRGDLTRHFGSVAIGLYAIAGSDVFNGGFHFAAPLNIPSRYKRNKVRIRAPHYYQLEYLYKSSRFGQTYETRPNENHSEQFYNAPFIRKEILNMSSEEKR